MAGRVWRSRSIRRGDYELEVTDANGVTTAAAFITLQHGVERPSLLMSRLLATIADHHGDTVQGAPGVDWPALGWTDQAEHDALVAEIAALIRAWRGHPHEQPRTAYVNVTKAERGIPHRPPYSISQADELDRIVRRAPAVVAQDLAAEGAAA